MSAYVVDLNHINYLINAALEVGEGYQTFSFYHKDTSGILQHYELTTDSASEYGQMLLDENIRSVSHRYGNDDGIPEQLPGPIDQTEVYIYNWNHYDGYRPVQVFKAIRCLNYQSCEHNSWEDSQAFAFLDALTIATISRIQGYDSAEWGSPEPNRSIKRLLG